MRIFPLGDNAVTIEFGNEVSIDLNRKARSLDEYFRSRPFAGYIESVPAYSSTTLFYDVAKVRENFPEFDSAFVAVSFVAEKAFTATLQSVEVHERTVEIPIEINDAAAADLGELSEFSKLDPDEVIALFLGRTYNVFMIGFLPGFAYMGEVDERIAMPRRQTPRIKVPAGSVAIAGRQTGVYPLGSPGGWNIIGRTEMKMFDPESDQTCPLRPGDQVKFVRA